MIQLSCFRRALLASLLAGLASSALADDWLITRVNGQWTWESTGVAGRVQKTLPNQEVLRLAENGAVIVMSLPPLAVGETVICTERARRNARDTCSSAFLVCLSDGGGMLASFAGLTLDGAQGAFDARNTYRCTLDENAVLEAARSVGMIEKVPPRP